MQVRRVASGWYCRCLLLCVLCVVYMCVLCVVYMYVCIVHICVQLKQKMLIKQNILIDAALHVCVCMCYVYMCVCMCVCVYVCVYVMCVCCYVCVYVMCVCMCGQRTWSWKCKRCGEQCSKYVFCNDSTRPHASAKQKQHAHQRKCTRRVCGVGTCLMLRHREAAYLKDVMCV